MSSNCEICVDALCLHQLSSLSTLSDEHKLKTIQKGRCTPALDLKQSHRGINRQFHSKYYEQFSWLTGCLHTQRLLCFPCILFSRSSNVWNNWGFIDLKNFHPSAKKHEQSERHLEASLKLAFFSNKHAGTTDSNQSRLDIHQQNNKVVRTRKIFERLIETVCLMAKQGWPFCKGKGLFLGLLELLAKSDGIIETYLLTENNALMCNANQIENDLVMSVASVVNERIKQQIQECDFVALMVEETPCSLNDEEHLVLILRYVHNSQVVDRFIKYIDVSEDKTADTVSSIIIKTLEEFGCLSKLITQTYDGVARMALQMRQVKFLVKQQCPQVLDVWCSAYVLNLILSKSFEHFDETRIFFSYIKAIANFFHGNPVHLAAYNEFADKEQLPHADETTWVFHSRIMNVLLSQKNQLKEFFEDIMANPDKWDGETLCEVDMFLNYLCEFECHFFLKTFSDVFVKSDILYESLLENLCDAILCKRTFVDFELNLKRYRSTFETIYAAALQVGPPKRKRDISDPFIHYRMVFAEIVDKVLSECQRRYSNIEEIEFVKLLSCEYFSQFSESFPDPLPGHIEGFEVRFDMLRLKSELRAIYKAPEFKDSNAYDIIQRIYSNNLQDVFPEVNRLGKLITTIPASTATEAYFTGLFNIQKYLQRTKEEKRLTEHSMIYIERELLTEIKNTSTFYDDVIQCYMKRDNCIDLNNK